jgi:Nuclease subunit of the excinuclease complex
VPPCAADARATGELLLTLIGLAQERGARTVADLAALSATRARRLLDKRHLAFGAPTRPGVYRFLGRNGEVLYVGRARDLRSRLRSYFRSDRQRPAVEAALAAAESIEWQVTGSELEAALEELRLIRELRPPGNARVSRPERQVWLRARGDTVVATTSQAQADRSRLVTGCYSARCGRDARRSSRRVHSLRTSWPGPRQRCHACAAGCAGSPTIAASRTRHGCATGSKLWSGFAAS